MRSFRTAAERFRLTFVLAALMAAAPVAWDALRGRTVTVDLTIELLAPDRPTVAQLYCKSGERYSGEQSVWLKYNEDNRIADGLYRFQVELPCGPDVAKLRFDPVWADGAVVVRQLRYHSYGWYEVDLEREFSRSMKILNSIRRFAPVEGGLLIESAGNDPFVELSTDLQRVARPGLGYLAVAFLGATLGCAILLRALLSAWWYAVARAEQLEISRRRLAEWLDGQLVDAAVRVWRAAWRPRSIDWIAWLLVLVVSSYGNWLFVTSIYSPGSAGAALAFLSATCQFQLVVLLALALRGVVGGSAPWADPALWSGLLLASGAYAGDALLHRINGMDLVHGLGMLLDGGVQNLGRNIAFMQLPSRVLLAYELGIAVFVAASLGLPWLTARASRARTASVSSVAWAAAAALAFGAIALEQAVGTATRSPRLVVREQALLPLYPVLRPASDTVLTYSAEVEPFRRKDLVVANDRSTLTPNGVRHVYLVILEGIRGDVIRPEVAPHLLAFQDEALTFSRGVADGNATHYGWYAIVNSRHPIYWETYRDSGVLRGSAALLAMRRAGFSIRVHTAKDLTYLQSLRIMFGDGEPVFDYMSPHPDIPAPEQDERVTDRLIEMSLAARPDERTMNLVFWDSMHFPYRWSEGMEGELTPYAGTPSTGVSLGVAGSLAQRDRPRIFNRYLNSTRFTDGLFGRFVEALKGAGLFDESLIVVVGDHGQQFMEHGFLMHGHTLYNEDIHVPLSMHLPNHPPGRLDVVASQVDIMATILDVVGLGDQIPLASDGVSVLSGDRDLEFATAATAGVQNTPSIFLLETRDWKLRFDLEARAPKESRALYVKEVRRIDDGEFIPGAGQPEDYRLFVEAELGEHLDRMGFVRVIPPFSGGDPQTVQAEVSVGPGPGA